MQRLIYGFKVVWGYYYFSLFVVFFFIFYPLFLVMLSGSRRRGFAAANNLRRFWAVIVLTMVGMPWRTKREAKQTSHQGVIFCPNHFSYLDIPTAMLSCDGNVRFMAKMELGNIPIFNIFFKTIDIPVNRASRTESYRALKKASESLDKGYNLIVFPEGTIGQHPPTLLPFKSGPFRLAIEKQVPIVPVTFIDNWRCLHVDKKIWGRPGRLRSVVHEAIPTKGMTNDDIESLKEAVYNVIATELHKHWGNGKTGTSIFAAHESRRQTR